MNCRTVLSWLLTLALVIQGLPARAVMVGCSMGSAQAACSKWSDPDQKRCCCQSGRMLGMACCRKKAGSMALGLSGDRVLGFVASSVSSLSKDGCKCEFAQLARPAQAVQGASAEAAVCFAPAILPTSLTLPTAEAETEPWLIGSDSSPPGRQASGTVHSRAPPIEAV